ncbi:MAG: exodeoxyribonuclease VII large subunit [Clostridia bacterium]|nr:exodeoxyribonuclease VII large subunit [Clostridia bacterium]
MDEPKRRIATVTQINNYIKAIFEQTPVLGNIWIKGEISNLKFHSSGHIYLTLKDEGATLRAVMFRGAASSLTFKPENGSKVLARGRISVYERDGQYQLYVEELEEQGKGDLYAKFEQLKKKLASEGLFDEARKKVLPQFPERVGIITSPTGAAVRDIINVLRRRYALCRAIIYPCLVQGDAAAQSIVRAIEYFNVTNGADVIIVGRGGGSIEDLWAFNEEAVARAVAASGIPIISAVGHETDFTICDFAADLRAPTPSAAAELAVPDAAQTDAYLANTQQRIKKLLKNRAAEMERHFTLLASRGAITRFAQRFDEASITLDRISDALTESFSRRCGDCEKRLSHLCASLDALSPLAILARGYAAVTLEGSLVKSVKSVNIGDKLDVCVSDGVLECDVRTKRAKGQKGEMKNEV